MSVRSTRQTIVALSAIDLDASIQCRANISTETVGEYAERMSDGDEFPAIVVFGTRTKCWIGDGWHRVLAARQNGDEAIRAELLDGGRLDALRYALRANARHGQRRTNEDKRRCVEIALREFPNLSSRGIAEMCAVSPQTVAAHRPALSNLDNATVTTSDGRQYPAKRQALTATTDEREPDELTEETHGEAPRAKRGRLPAPCQGLVYAQAAIRTLEQIQENDTERQAAFAFVKEWLDAQR